MKGDSLHFYRLHYGLQAKRYSHTTSNDLHQASNNSRNNAMNASRVSEQLHRSFKLIQTRNKIANRLQMLTIRRMKLTIPLARKVSSQHKPTRFTRNFLEISLHFNSEVP